MSAEKTAAPAIALTADDLKSVISAAVATAIEEARKPVLSDKDKADILARNEERKENAARETARRENVIAMRKICTHLRRDGTCRAVYVKGCGDVGSGGFLICQACQAKIWPGIEPTNYDGTDLFNTELFNRLFQMAGQSDIIA